MISGTVLGYMDCMLFEKPENIPTDEIVIDIPINPVCRFCHYWVDNRCWWTYMQRFGDHECNYTPKGLLERSNK